MTPVKQVIEDDVIEFCELLYTSEHINYVSLTKRIYCFTHDERSFRDEAPKYEVYASVKSKRPFRSKYTPDEVSGIMADLVELTGLSFRKEPGSDDLRLKNDDLYEVRIDIPCSLEVMGELVGCELVATEKEWIYKTVSCKVKAS